MTASSPESRIQDAWVRLEAELRSALPVCAVAPPTQVEELLSALRINGVTDPDTEDRVRELRRRRNEAAFAAGMPTVQDAEAFEAEVDAVISRFRSHFRSGRGPTGS
ncbi:MAG: hypothetical protein ACE5GJ_02150 [Gemmatimonadota bacterium]